MAVFTALLFVVLTPGVVLTLPSKASSKLVIVAVHGLIFALIYNFIHNAVRTFMSKYEGFPSVCSATHPDGICPANYQCTAKGFCVSKFK
jgi:hypothetical protein